MRTCVLVYKVVSDVLCMLSVIVNFMLSTFEIGKKCFLLDFYFVVIIVLTSANETV